MKSRSQIHLGKLRAGLRSRSHKESEVFGWSRIPNNTRSRSRIFLSDFGCPLGSFFTSHS